MTETVTPPQTPRAAEDVTEEGVRASVELNGAVVLRGQERRVSASKRAGSASTSDAENALAERAQELHSAVIAELARRRDAAGLEPADSVPAKKGKKAKKKA